MSHWPTMNYYAWRDWCEVHGDGRDHDTRVFVGPEAQPTEWYLTERRWDGQPPLDAWVRVPLWALRATWDTAFPVSAARPPTERTGA